ncbi:hypothetical protein OHB12_30190 [Nocardia sp. NBC_01730]|uniref:hypothetical protein n=1 Tax=Nocardia sp. NBC_01730 TaxID=2975998 RepID=UPI002E0F90CD|nr:hypothetical protein OHB12_30190 [Nocardia sp. NBC_01730]
MICAVPNSNVGGLLDDLPEHPEIYEAAEETRLHADRRHQPVPRSPAGHHGRVRGTDRRPALLDRESAIALPGISSVDWNADVDQVGRLAARCAGRRIMLSPPDGGPPGLR